MEVAVPSVSTSTEAQNHRLFQCSTCKRSFTRVDHLTRHVRSHTRHKPYVCPTCNKGFARVDLLKRHAANHADDHENKRQKRGTVRQNRVVQACEACSQNHLRCEDEKPCSRCRKKSIACRVPSSPMVNELDTIHAAQDLLDLSNDLDHRLSVPSSRESPPTHTHLDNGLHIAVSANASNMETIPSNEFPQGVNADQRSSTQDTITQNPYLEHATAFDVTPAVDPLLPDYLRNMPPFEPPLSGQITPRGIMDMGFNWDINLTDFDMDLLDKYNFQIPFDAQTASSEPPPGDPTHDSVAVRAEAFKKSVWRYLPQRNRDFGAAEEHNLALADADMDTHHRTRISSRRAVQEKLHRVMRDKLIALCLTTCKPGNVNRVASAFPSIELLDGLVQYFLTSPSINAKSWFHLPTLSLSKQRPELLANMIAAGAVATPDVPLRKLGLALQEAARAAMANAFEEDNSAIRDLHHARNLMLSLDIGMWSGISRKMEIAESFLQPLVTMLRRGGRFRRSTWEDIMPTPEDEGKVLDDQWKRWVSQEAYIRLVHHAFELDRKSSMALLKPPLISYAEMQLPLPSGESLWEASSAKSWKTEFLNNPQNFPKRPSPPECLLDLQYAASHSSAGTAYLYVLWGMLWEYRQATALTAQSPLKQHDTLILSSRHQELAKLLEDFRVSNCALKKEDEITMNIMFMHLHAPLENIQLFAGIEGQEEAARVYPILSQWITTSSARQALWYAGQVLRAAEGLSKGMLCNFNAIAVYHAGLLFWSYGFLKRSVPNGSSAIESSQLVCLNDEETLEAKRFMALDRGTPALRSGAQTNEIPINNISAIIDLLMHILRSNHELIGGTCPPLVENLVQLMEGLRPTAS